MVKENKKTNLYDAIVVLGVAMVWNGEAKRWDFPAIIEQHPDKLVLGEARAMAVKEIQNLADVILVTGGVQAHPETGETASRSRQLAQLITERYGVPGQKVIAIGTSRGGSTMGNIKDLVCYLKRNPAVIKLARLAVLCPRLQVKRAKLMFESEPYFKDHNLVLDWLTVEDILEEVDPQNKKWIAEIYQSPEAEIAKQMEEKGIRAFKEGKYKSPAGTDNQTCGF